MHKYKNILLCIIHQTCDKYRSEDDLKKIETFRNVSGLYVKGYF